MILTESLDPNSIGILLQIVLILVLTLINAFFAASELAILSVNKNRMKVLADEGNKKAKTILDFNEEQTKFLSTIQVGITLAGLFSSATAATALSDDFATFLQGIGLPYMPTLAMIVITVILSYVTLVFGELFPKRIALRFPEKVAMFVAPVIRFTTIVATPFVKLLSGSCNLLVKITRLEKNISDEKISEEEILSVLNTGKEDGVLSNDEMSYINRIFEFEDLTAEDVMTPKVNCFILNLDLDFKEQMHLLSAEQYTRVPVYKGSSDEIVGVINVKDILFALDENKEVNLETLVREPLYVHKHMSLKLLMKNFLASNNHMALVIDEFGSFCGIVSLEDAIEELVGDIDDEYDLLDEIIDNNDNTYTLNGSVSILDINRELNIDIERSDNYNTIGGYIIEKLGYIPSPNDDIEIEEHNYKITVLTIKNNKIEKVLIKKM